MSRYAGVDVSSFAIDIVLLNEDGTDATHIRRRLDHPTKASALTRVRRIRDQLPPRTDWNDQGILRAAIEKPYAAGQMRGNDMLMMAIGSVLQMIPQAVPVDLLRADDWRKACGLPTRGERLDLKRAALNFTGDHWADHPTPLDDNTADAYCIAWACRHLHQKGTA